MEKNSKWFGTVLLNSLTEIDEFNDWLCVPNEHDIIRIDNSMNYHFLMAILNGR